MNDMGIIEVVTGCMYAGKTEELLRKVSSLEKTGQKFVVFKPKLDNRYADDYVVSHNANKVKAISIDQSSEILSHLETDLQCILIDEAQFFDDYLIDIVEYVIKKGVDIFAVGLDMDFKASPFITMAKLMAKANNVLKLTSYCSICNKPATRTQRIIDSIEASYHDPVVLLGAKQTYEARCCSHHVIRDFPNIKEE